MVTAWRVAVLIFWQVRERQPRTATSGGRNAAARQQHRANAAMWLVKGAPNLMQRLSRLPPVPNVALLDRRKSKSLSWPHANTTFTQQTYIRWCCIDLSNAPRLSGT